MSIYGKKIFDYRDNYILSEAYIGKTPILLEIEDAIGEVRKNLNFYSNLNSSKEVLKVNRLFEKQFGMEICALKIYQSSTPNAYTQVIATRFDIAERVIMSNMVVGDKVNGYRFRDGNDFCLICNIAYGLLADKQYSNAEIVAILLHEIGHNFADCIYSTIEVANRDMMNNYRSMIIIIAIIQALTIVGIPNAIATIKQYFELNNRNMNKKEKKSQSKKPSKLAGLVGGVKGKISDFSDFLNSVLTRLFGIGSIKLSKREAELQGVKDKVRTSVGRQNEVFADKFAGVYGYGPEQASALLKLESTPSKASNFINKISEELNDRFNDVVRDINDFDVHPQLMQRINSEISLLKNELKKEDIDPKVKKAIESQLNELNKIVKKATEQSKDFSKNENAQALYNAYINNNCPTPLANNLEEAIEKALDDALEKK